MKDIVAANVFMATHDFSGVYNVAYGGKITINDLAKEIIRLTGITDEMYLELERLIEGAKPASRHLTGLAISLSTTGRAYVGASCYDGDLLTVYPYAAGEIVVGGEFYPASAIHLIDNLRVSA